MSIVHVPGHQKGRDIKARGNQATDMAAREAADRDCTAPILTVGLPPPGMGTLPPTPKYSSSDLNWIQKNASPQEGKDGWYQDQDDNLILPTNLGQHLCTHLHLTTHLGEKKTNLLTDSTFGVSPTTGDCTRHSPGLQSVPDDKAGKRTAYGNEVPGREARATLGDRFYRGKTRQVWVPLSVSFGEYFFWVGGSIPY